MIRGADFSKWDGGGFPYHVMDWGAYTWDFAFIKCSEGTVIDPLFDQQWKAAATAGVVRGAYHFFRSYVDPKLAVEKTLFYLDGDQGELPIALDLEDTNGRSDTLSRARIWLEEYRRKMGIRPMIYTSPYFWNDILKAQNETWAEEYKLWLATYPFDKVEPAALREKRITQVLSGEELISFPLLPKPFKRRPFWQWTALAKPEQVPGYYTGPGRKEEVDLIFYEGDHDRFLYEFAVEPGGSIPTSPPANGGSMETHYFEARANVAGEYRTVRAQASPHINGLSVGKINSGSFGKVYFDQLYTYSADVVQGGTVKAKAGDIWWHAFEANGQPIDGWVAEIHLGRPYLFLKEVGVPTDPPPTVDDYIVHHLADGTEKKYVPAPQ